MKNNKKIISFVILFLISIMAYLIIKDIYILNNYEHVESTVKIQRIGNKNKKIVKCIYTYNGKNYEEHLSKINLFKMKDGKKIKVYLIPSQPEKIYYPDILTELIILIFIIVCGIFLLKD